MPRRLRLAPFVAAWALALGCAHTVPEAEPVAIAPPPPPPADPLAEGLPGDTLFYLRIDLARVLAGIEEAAVFLHPEAGREVSAQASRLWAAARKMLAQRGFRPALGDHLFEGVLHLAVLGDPEVEAGTAVALLLETEPGLAEGFLRDLRAFLERDAAADGRGVPYTLLEAPPGELLQLQEEPRLLLGRLGRYLLLSDVRSPRLWAALQGPAAAPLSASELHGRFFGRERPVCFFYGSVRGLLDALERQLERQITALPQAVSTPEADPRLLADALRAQLEGQRKLRRDLGLDSLDGFGGRVAVEVEGAAYRGRAEAELLLSAPPGRLLALLLDSGRTFVSPGPVPLAALTLLWRVDPVGLLDEILALAGPEAAQRFQTEVDAAAQGRTGFTVRALLGALSGDLTLLYDPPPPPEPGAAPEAAAAAAALASYPALLLGVHDRSAAAQILSALFEAGAKEPMLGPNLSREQLLGVELLVLNPGGGPSRDYAMAVALLERHLAAGSFTAVSDLIRRSREGGDGGPLSEILAAHPGANLVLVMSQRFSRWLESLVGAGQGSETYAELRRAIQDLDLTGEEPEAAREARESMLRLVDLIEVLRQAQERMDAAPAVLSGRALPGRYRLEAAGELRHPPAGGGVP